MCHAQRVTSDPAVPPERGVTAEGAGTSAVLERATGAVMALTGCSADAAFEELTQRAKAGNRTLIEECWITLGGLLERAPRIAPAPVRPSLGTVSPDAPTTQDRSGVLARLGEGLVHVRTTQDLAGCLLEHLGPPVGADAVMIYARLPAGGLELAGRAGIDDTLAAQWRRLPPLSGFPALDALRSGEPRWLEGTGADQERYLPIGGHPGRWRASAWLPVRAGDTAEVSVGLLREHGGPFTPGVRELLGAVVPLCAGRLRTLSRDTADAALDAVAAVIGALPGAVALLRPLRAAAGGPEDHRVVAATPEAADLLGLAGRPLIGLRLGECWPDADDTLRSGLRRALDTGEPYEAGPFALPPGAAAPAAHSVRAERLGDGLVVSWSRSAPTDQQEQRLADMQRLGNLGWASWNLVTDEALWSDQVHTALALDPADGPLPLTALPALAVPEDRPVFTGAVRALLRDGRPLDVPFRIRTAGTVRHLRAVAETVQDAQGTPVEVHGFVQDLTAQRSAELALVESERAVLVQHGALQAERALAGRLQHALLPLPRRQPLRLAGLRVEVAYLPAQSGLHVGGDWFSAIELPDGSALFVVGDVAGHGVDAVATMAQLRFTAKGMVSTGSSPTGALSRLNTLLLHSHDPHGTATMVLARYHPEERRLAWAQAGHPPPLLKRGGEVRYLDRPAGMLLGATATPHYEEAECRLEPGDRLLLYTDGLVERPGEIIDSGLERLARAATARHLEAPGSLSPLLSAVLEGEDERRDDVCVLDIRVPLGPR
ncbi:SpoIIE family protein phosphatase [Streptomyces sp. NPDC057877]|uniref:SpoIIE family protein phosphatase n=1 Tax=Streptomyces sp. NPDC057877 TaxID=3346269 RepID=UPI00368BECEA